MGEAINTQIDGRKFRGQLLMTASATALLVCVYCTGDAKAADGDTDRPVFWIELGGQLERVDGGLEAFAPPFVSQLDAATFTSPIKVQHPPHYANGAQTRLTFQPEDTDWVLAASVRYGRSVSKRQPHEETSPASGKLIISNPTSDKYETQNAPPLARRFSDAESRNDEAHAILDFQVGKDVGLGLWGAGGKSVFSAGVRFAQFSTKAAVILNADPDFHISEVQYTHLPPPLPPIPINITVPVQTWHLYNADAQIARNFHGVGPSFAWDASAPFAGHPDAAELTLDWGLNAAILFGRQKAKAHHETTDNFRPKYPHRSHNVQLLTQIYHHSYHPSRSKTVTVPNIGGFAGVSLKFPNAKISLGYRGDFFFGAMDGGIDTAKKENRGFYGPFATISFGIGG